ncbi:hypothetical protein Tco_0776213 [Tanacetum coccineum]
MVRLWWLWWPQPARPPPQRWRQAAEHREAPRGVTPPQPDTTWQDPEVLRGFRGVSPAVGGSVMVGVVEWWWICCGDEERGIEGDEGGGRSAARIRRKNPPEKMEARRKSFSGGGAGQWWLPEIGEEGEREFGLYVYKICYK